MAMEATKNIFCAKDQGEVDYSTVTKELKTFRSGCKNVYDQTGQKAWIPRPFSKLSRQTHRVAPGEYLMISVSHSPERFATFKCNGMQNCQIVPYVTKTLQNIWQTQVLTFLENDNAPTTQRNGFWKLAYTWRKGFTVFLKTIFSRGWYSSRNFRPHKIYSFILKVAFFMKFCIITFERYQLLN